MESPATQHSRINYRPRKAKRAVKYRTGTISQLQIVFAVAFVVATLFTAWTPGQFYSSPTSQNANFAIVPTPSPFSQDTETQRGPLIIGIVAGHWKNDSGAVCPDGLKEVDVNLNIASLTQKILGQ